MSGVTARWTLRRRLVAVLVGLLAAMAAAMGSISTLVLQDSLVDQLDDRLEASSFRSVAAQDRPAVGSGHGGGHPRRPPGLDAPGQEAGTISASFGDDAPDGGAADDDADDATDDGATGAGYYDERGDYHQLTGAQVASLRDVPADDEPHTVTVDGLGRYRALASVAPDDDVVVTALPTDEATATVQRYLLAEGAIVLAGLGLAGVAAGGLVRRELRPLERIAATATRVSELPLHQGEVALAERVPDVDTDATTEVGQVGAALNRLLGHVESALGERHRSETQVRQFVADASHELRTPLASIRGYAELVRRLPADLPDDALRAMERVESESRRMTVLVEDMLLLARLDAGRPLDRTEVDLTALAVDAVADAHAAGPDHRWRLDLPTPAEPDGSTATGLTLHTVLGDEDRLRQVLVNLLANARVHTPAGTTVTTSVRRAGDGAVVLAVTDDGPGIPAPLRDRLFQRFTRGDAARSPGSGSTGLGLAIVDAVVRAHGGTVRVDGTPGATTFTVTLGAADDSPPAAPRATSATTRPAAGEDAVVVERSVLTR